MCLGDPKDLDSYTMCPEVLFQVQPTGSQGPLLQERVNPIVYLGHTIEKTLRAKKIGTCFCCHEFGQNYSRLLPLLGSASWIQKNFCERYAGSVSEAAMTWSMW